MNGNPTSSAWPRRLLLLPAAGLAAAAVAWAAPAAPPWLDGSVVGKEVRLLWMPVEGAQRYLVFRDGARVGEAVDYEFTAPAPGNPGTWSYEVSAVDGKGGEGPRSPAAEVRVNGFPQPPSHFVLRPELFGPKVRLRWGGVTGAAGYRLYRGVGREGPLIPLAAVDQCTYVDTRVKYGRKYRYSVCPLDQAGNEGERTPAAEVQTPTPGPC